VHEYSDDDGTGGGGGGGDDDDGGDDEASAVVVVQWRWQRRSQRRTFWGHARCAAAAMALAKEVTRLPTAWATAFAQEENPSRDPGAFNLTHSGLVSGGTHYWRT
jgi:hypothetical protein